MNKLTRRRFIRKSLRLTARAAGVAGVLAMSHQLMRRPRARYPLGRGKYPREVAGLIRPPGAVEEDSFLPGCIRCYRCQDACSPGAIQFYSESAGKHYHTPYIDPSVTACTLCMKCTQVCPTHVLEPMTFSERGKVRMARVELRKDLCLSHKAKRIRDEQALLMETGREAVETTAWAERRGPCGECFTVCPLRRRAITLEPGAFLAPVIHDDACVGCGLCEEICRVMVRGEPALKIVPTRRLT